MLRTSCLLFLAVAIAAVPAHGASRAVLMPGVTYEREVQFTRHGPVAMHVISAPRPLPPYDLRPVLSNNVVPGLERLTAMQRRSSAGSLVAGLSGDESTAGLFAQDGVLHSLPLARRSAIAIDAQGTLRVERLSVFATWWGSGPRRPGLLLNQRPGRNGGTLFTPSWGASTPAASDTVEAVLSTFPAVVPSTDVSGQVVEISQGGGKRIPPGGAVLVARGTQAGRLAAEAPVGTIVSARFLTPGWAGILHAVGGGPILVKAGRPVFRAAEEFTIGQLALRQARSAVGQRADGRLLLVAVDGGQPGYSTGMTNFELAQALVRLGAVTASGLTIGRSTTMAFQGRLLNRPRGGVERAVADALLLSYTGPRSSK